MSVSLLRQLLMKEAVKKSAGSSGIMTINKGIAADVEKLVQKYVNDALAQGVDLDTLGPEQLKMIVAMNSKPTNRVISGSSPEGRAITEKLLGKKSRDVNIYSKQYIDNLDKEIIDSGLYTKKEWTNLSDELKEARRRKFDPNYDDAMEGMVESNVVDMTGKNIDTSQGIMGGKSVKELMESGQVQKGTDNIKISEKITDREMFKDANKKFNQTDVVADTIARITSMEPVAAMKEANKIIGRKGIYKNLDETQSKKILQDTEDWIFQRDPADRYDYKKNRPFRDDPNFDPDDPDYNPDDYAKGGRAGYYTGGMIDVEPNLSDIGHGSDSLMARTRLVSPDGQATTSTGLNYLLAEDNDNIRVPFGSGKRAYDHNSFDHKINSLNAHYKRYKKMGGTIPFEIFSEAFAKENFAEGGRIGFQGGGMGRRAFLKLLATLGGGIAGIKTGILGLGGKKTGKQVAKEVVKSAGASGNPPPYFFKLVEKIKTLGDDTLATQDKAIAKKYKDYVMEEDFAGNIEIIKKGDDIAGNKIEDVYMRYTVDEVPLRGKKGSSKVEEYEEYTARPDGEGKMKDVEPGVPDEVVMEVEAGSGNVPESFYTGPDKIKKADGGRIGFSPGGLANVLARLGIKGSSGRFLEKVFGKEGFKEMTKNDPDMYRGLLEVVEMFRSRDKEGLKSYMKNFLPHMDDAEIEQFIVGSTPDIEGLSGQLTRLGSGRDYSQKLQMMKNADEVKKLEKFDIKNVTKNAEGGRIGLFLGGGLTAGKGLLKNMLKFMAKDGSHKKSPAEVLKMLNPKQFQKLLNDPRYMGKVSSEAPEGLDKIIQDMIGKTKTERSDMVGDIISTSRNIKKVDDDILKYKLKIIEDMVSKGIDREIAVEAAENISKEVAKSAGKKSTPKITEQGLLELENLQKNLLTKDRKLQAQGGLTTMLGE